MRRIIYVSSAKSADIRVDCETILATARRRNAEADVTGLLILSNGSFFQVLEGDEGAVQQIYDDILRDPRHNGVIKLIDEDVVARAFPEWSMAWLELSPDDPLAGEMKTCAAEAERGRDVEAIAPRVSILLKSFVDMTR